MISCRDRWPWTKPGYITKTRRQSNNQWCGGIAAHPTPPQKFRVQKSAGKVLASILGSRRHPPHWLSFKGPNYQCGVLLISAAAATEGHFEGITPRVSHQGGLFLDDNVPAHRALATQKKPVYLGFQCLDHPPYSPDLAPSDYHLFPGLKKQERSPFFVRRGGHCWREDLVGRTTFDFFLLSGLRKLEQRAKKCSELRREYEE